MYVLHKWSERVNLASRTIGTGRVAARPVHDPSAFLNCELGTFTKNKIGTYSIYHIPGKRKEVGTRTRGSGKVGGT